MTHERADPEAVLREYEASRDPAGDPARESLIAALFVEDVFGITPSDAEIAPESLGDVTAMRALIARHQSPP